MSQSGLLTEEEIKNYISESFNIRLEREQFLKPNKEFVFDIYSRFLDDFHSRWRNSDAEEPNIKAIMVGQIRNLLKHYNTAPIFQFTDLFAPNRKRTTTFLNVLIFMKAQLDDEWFKYQRKKDERAAYQEEVQRLKSEIAQLLPILEELAIKKATIKPLEELHNENKKKSIAFKSVSLESEELGEQAKKLKARITVLMEQQKNKQKRAELLDVEINQMEMDLKLISDGPLIKERSKALKMSIDNKTEQLRTIQNECQELEKKIPELDKFLILDQAQKAGQDANIIEGRLQQATTTLTELTGETLYSPDSRKEIDQNKEKMKLQFNIILEEAKAKSEERLAERDEICQKIRARQEEGRLRVEEIRKKRNALLAEKTAHSEKCRLNVEKANRQLETLIKSVQDSKQADLEIKVARGKYISRVEKLLGCQKEIDQPANKTYTKPADCTYIKESTNK